MPPRLRSKVSRRSELRSDTSSGGPYRSRPASACCGSRYRAPLRAFLPFAPFLVIGIISGLLGDKLLISVRSVTFWLLMFLSAFVSATMLTPRAVAFVLTHILLLIVFASIAMSVLNPAVGVSAYGGEMVWIGVFTQKNTLGYFAMSAFLCAYAFHPTIGRLRTALLGIGAAACLVMSGSMGGVFDRDRCNWLHGAGEGDPTLPFHRADRVNHHRQRGSPRRVRATLLG